MISLLYYARVIRGVTVLELCGCQSPATVS